MIGPLVPYAIKGVIWYQGESNESRAEQYSHLFPALIDSWRAAWNNPNMPFYYVQIAPYRGGSWGDNSNKKETGPELRESQMQTLTKNDVIWIWNCNRKWKLAGKKTMIGLITNELTRIALKITILEQIYKNNSKCVRQFPCFPTF